LLNQGQILALTHTHTNTQRLVQQNNVSSKEVQISNLIGF